MSSFETTSITVAHGRRCEDRVRVIDFEDGVVIAVADGAGGTSCGEEAAETVIREIVETASSDHDEGTWCGILKQIDLRIGVGESTGVIVACSNRGLVGACVGDSQAWLIVDGELLDLTKNRVRKPLLGSGKAIPTGFSHPSSRGLLIVATDGFCNYVKRDVLLKEILWIEFLVLARKLVEMVRLPSGDLWDDVGIVVCRPRPKAIQRKQYKLSDLV